MGVRGEVFSTKVALQNRTYFFNVKENRLGDLYLNIVESKNRDEGGFERQSVILFADDLQEFLKGFDESLRVLEKSVRDKRRGTKNQAGSERPSPRQGERERSDSTPRRKREEPQGYRGGSERGRSGPRGSRDGRGRSEGYGERRRPEGASNPRFSERNDGPRFGERHEGSRHEKGERTGRPRQERSDFAPRKKRVVIRKK